MDAVQPSPYEPFSLAVEPGPTGVTVVPSGELDMDSTPLMSRQVHDLFGTGVERVVIDLGRVSFMDSTGLRGLLELREHSMKASRELTLASASGPVLRVFAITSTREMFNWDTAARSDDARGDRRQRRMMARE
jgi:anti-sigma B factor antagonist